MRSLLSVAIASALAVASHGVLAGASEAQKWIDEEFQPSTLSKEEQLSEMEWFIEAAEPFKGMEINVLSETVSYTHLTLPTIYSV